MFSHGEDLANMILSSDLPHKACTAIINTPIDNHDPPLSISIQQFSLPDNVKIIAFRSLPKLTVQQLEEDAKELVPSNDPFFKFKPTKLNPYISKAAFNVFGKLYDDKLSFLQDKIDISKPLLVTGNSFAGSIASLFTLWLLDSVYKETSKRPTCITFGSPLLGNINFQKAIHENSSWPKCFLHVALNQDPIPKLFISSNYKPFGSFLFCSNLGSACFDQPESVFDVMVAMSSQSSSNMALLDCNLNMEDYKNVLDKLKSKVIYKGKSELGDYNYNSLRVGIVLQLEPIGLILTQQQEVSNDIKGLIEKLAKPLEHELTRKKAIVDPKRKLNDSKLGMAYLEWYKKVEEEKAAGYYDGFKKPASTKQKRRKAEIEKPKATLKKYWKEVVQKADQFPQKKEQPLHTSSLYAATNYRKMYEPLDIASYYMRGNTDYINSGRSDHYKLLEKWFNNAKESPIQPSNTNKRKKASLTEDSCFWAHVEEAVISLRVLKNGERTQEDGYVTEQKLIDFEHYLIVLIRNDSVSTDIFLEKSTYMNWWKEYEQYKGAEYKSELTTFMKDELQTYIS